MSHLLGYPLLLFGIEQPKLNFKQSPEFGLSIYCDNLYSVTYSPGKRLTWVEVIHQQFSGRLLESKVKEDMGSAYLAEDFLKSVMFLDELNGTHAEKTFFRKYVERCDEFDWEYKIGLPALIPQVWVNWLHYDPKDKERAQKTKKEPFRVDFMIAHENRIIVIEIDGSSHFSEPYIKEQTSGVGYLANIDVFTTHLKRDRWLRKQGWEVYRFSNKEVEEESIFYFAGEINNIDIIIPLENGLTW